jgi:uncharacterized protein (TIGR03083 family)
MRLVEPLDTVGLFPPLSRKLIAVLKALQSADWDRPTVCGPWSVKDVAAHLLGGNLNRVWNRTGISTSTVNPIPNYAELLSYINRNNEAWVQAAKRISPELMIELLALTDRRLYQHFRGLDGDKLASISVAWAGDDLAPNWFDIAREYTEKWLHQQHIREAVSAHVLTGRKWLYPVLDIFLRGLPHAYRALKALDGTSISVLITGPAGGAWALVREDSRWRLFSGSDPDSACRVQIDQDLAWRLFTKGATREDARRQVRITGSTALGEPVLDMVSIIA